MPHKSIPIILSTLALWDLTARTPLCLLALLRRIIHKSAPTLPASALEYQLAFTKARLMQAAIKAMCASKGIIVLLTRQMALLFLAQPLASKALSVQAVFLIAACAQVVIIAPRRQLSPSFALSAITVLTKLPTPHPAQEEPLAQAKA